MLLRRFFSNRIATVAATGCVALSALSQPAAAVVLSYMAIDSPALAVFNGQLFLAYAGIDSNHRLNYAVSSDGVSFTQVTDGSNRATNGPALAVFNSKMYVAFTGADHKINIASSTDGQHYSGQYVPNSNWFSGHKPALGAGAGQLWLAWQGDDGGLYTASSTNGTSWTMGPTTPAQTSAAGTSQVAYPPTLASADASTVPWVVLTWSQVVPGNPNLLQIKMGPVSVPSPGATCRQAYVTTGAGIQGGLGYLPSERLMPWIYGGQIALDINGGSCASGGVTYPSATSPTSGGSYGNTGLAPAAIGFNGHVFVAWTGTGGQNINIIEPL
jgi:hypothetical protein